MMNPLHIPFMEQLCNAPYASPLRDNEEEEGPNICIFCGREVEPGELYYPLEKPLFEGNCRHSACDPQITIQQAKRWNITF